MGAVHCTKAVWPVMTAQKYGRIVMTTSSSGLYGNFGQSNYGAAKMALVGLMQTLSLEGAKHDIRVNAIAPTAATRMTEDLLPPAMLEALRPGPSSRRCSSWRARARADAHHPNAPRRQRRGGAHHVDPGAGSASAPTRRRCWRRTWTRSPRATARPCPRRFGAGQIEIGRALAQASRGA